MKIENVNIVDILPYSNNPRKNDSAVDLVIKSIKEFGFLVPIILDDKNTIVAGHTRVKAAIKLNLETVPCIYTEGLTEDQIKAFRIMDNKSHELSMWDEDLLKTELMELKELDFNLDLTGFNEIEIDKLIDSDLKEQELPNHKEPKYDVRIEDIWQLGNHRLMCGDATNEEDVKRLMNEQTSKLMVTDPPYGVKYNPKWRDEADKKGILGNRYPVRALGEVKNDDIIDWSEAYKLFDTDVIYNWHASWFTSLVQENLEKVGYEIIASIIWAKPHFALSQGNYHWQHEPCWYAVKIGKNHNWQGSRTESTVWSIAGMNAMGASQDKDDERTGHGTQKPIECMKRPIVNNSKEEDIVVDPFGGSGTTLIACEQTNRKCYMMEIDEDYCSVIIERWENLTKHKAKKIGKQEST